jgi:nitroreductase
MARVELRDILRKRRMVHQFTREPVAEETLLRILEIARHAPSAGFSQGFRLVVLDDPSRVEWFWRVTTPPDELEELDERIATGPPVVVLPFTSKAAYLDRYSAPDKAGFGLQSEEAWPVPFWHVDAGMAIMLILLAAVDEGLCGWYFGIVHGESDLLPELGIPDQYALLGAIAIGHRAPEDVRTQGSAFSRPRVSVDELVRRSHW